MDEEDKRKLVRDMLTAVGENCEREGLVDTPKRVVKMWNEIFRGYDRSQMPIVTTFFNGKDRIVYDEMISDTGSFYSHCEHHMVPFFGRYWFAYIPHPKGKILGLSKVGRIVDWFSAKLQVQERLTHDVVEHLWKSLANEKDPIGMGLVMEGEHLCKSMRGVKKKGKMRTTYLMGAIKDDPAARAEFMDWVNKNGEL